MPSNKRISLHGGSMLFSAADGPESLEIYTSADGAAIDWAGDSPALYIEASVNGAYVRLGPFHLRSIREALERALNKTASGSSVTPDQKT